MNISDRLSIHNIAEAYAHLEAQLNDSDELLIDLSNITTLDTSGLQMLVMLKHIAAAQGKTIEINTNDLVVESAKRLGLSQELGI